MVRLAFASPARNGYYEEVLRGFREWMRAQADVEPVTFLGREELDPPALAYVEADGALVAALGPAGLPPLLHSMPLVSFSNHEPKLPIPYVVNDDREAGRLGARILAAGGYRSFAAIDRPEMPSRLRTEGLREEAARLGIEVHLHRRQLSPGPDPGRENLRDLVRDSAERLRTFLGGLPAGTGIFSPGIHDALEAEQVLRTIRPGAVPDQLGILAGDLPPAHLRSRGIAHVKLAGDRIGARAGELLLGLVRGTELPGARVERIPPRGHDPGVTLRPDELTRLVRRLRAYCLERLADDVSVDDLGAHVGLARRTLETRLRAAGLPAPYALLLELRLERAEELLRSTNLPIERIAELVGFRECRTFTKRFRVHRGESPRAWRRRHRGPRPC